MLNAQMKLNISQKTIARTVCCQLLKTVLECEANRISIIFDSIHPREQGYFQGGVFTYYFHADKIPGYR